MVFLDLNLDGVQQMRLAQARRPVDEQRVVRAGRVRCDGLRGRKRKLVRRAFDEVFKGEVVAPAGQRALVQLRLVGLVAALGGRSRHKVDVDVKAEHRLEGLLQQCGVAVGYDIADKIRAQLQRDDLGIFEADRTDVLDVKSIGRVGGLLLAIGLDRFHYLVDGIHEFRYSPLPVYDGTPCAENRAQKY